MRKNYLLLGAGLLALSLPSAFGQTKLFVNLKNSSVKEYSITDIRKLTFASSKLQVVTKNNATEEVPLTDLSYLNFSKKTITSLISNTTEANGASIQLHPNPLTQNTLTVSYHLEAPAVVNMELLTIEGQVESTLVGSGNKGHNENAWTLPELVPGFYLCRIKMGDKVKTMKIVKY